MHSLPKLKALPGKQNYIQNIAWSVWIRNKGLEWSLVWGASFKRDGDCPPPWVRTGVAVGGVPWSLLTVQWAVLRTDYHRQFYTIHSTWKCFSVSESFTFIHSIYIVHLWWPDYSRHYKHNSIQIKIVKIPAFDGGSVKVVLRQFLSCNIHECSCSSS